MPLRSICVSDKRCQNEWQWQYIMAESIHGSRIIGQRFELGLPFWQALAAAEVALRYQIVHELLVLMFGPGLHSEGGWIVE